MNVEIREETTSAMAEYGRVFIAFMVESQLRVQPLDNGLKGWSLVEEIVEPPYLKDYDANKEEGPARWLSRDTSNWSVFSAFQGSTRLGGAVVAWNTAGVNILEGRDDLACLWDIRIDPEYRRVGIGFELFAAVTEWVRAKGCRHLKVETQNINVPTCHFYARQGCELRTIHPGAYPELPDEVQVLWYKDL